MEKIEYNITQKEFKKLEKLSENIYNTSVVIDYFCVNQSEIEELNNLTPIVSNLRKDADIMNAFFINFDKNDWFLKNIFFELSVSGHIKCGFQPY